MFPKKLTEDPILPDAARVRLGADLELQQNRVAAERLALRLAAGAARGRVMFSYPRVDLDQGRPRVPSFYALELMRAAEGRLPGFDELAKRAAGEQATRLGWPAPARPSQQSTTPNSTSRCSTAWSARIDEATTGAAHYLLGRTTRIWRARCARARGDGSSDGRRPTAWSIPGPRCAPPWPRIVPTRVPIRRPRCRISPPARITSCSRRFFGWSRAKKPRRSR